MSALQRGRFITLEGGEGAGKTTAMQVVIDWLEQDGRTVVRSREPGGTRAAERIREVLLDPSTGELDPLSELLLMFAARVENLVHVIRPTLAKGQDVVCDRFTDASAAYQGGGRELGPEPIRRLAGLVHPDLAPDLTLLLDVPVAVGLARIRNRTTGPDRIEQAREGFLERVRKAYLAMAEAEPERFCVIDASQPLDKVRADIQRALDRRLR